MKNHEKDSFLSQSPFDVDVRKIQSMPLKINHMMLLRIKQNKNKSRKRQLLVTVTSRLGRQKNPIYAPEN